MSCSWPTDENRCIQFTLWLSGNKISIPTTYITDGSQLLDTHTSILYIVFNSWQEHDWLGWMFLLSCWQKRFVSEDLCLWWCEQLMLWMWSYVKMPLRVMRDSESLQYLLWCCSLCGKLWCHNAGKRLVIFLRHFFCHHPFLFCS